ncbi:hypothetical protein L484_019238 [Morus notabilis]|uniref:DUF620 domain-containing protein n=1 Tax=Morus notabilis TaxID=981085 RepID=W9QYT6_9ROSA|nr:uncharacterized protein LOC21402185 [Morus notabilis]EXB51245.1 hypothetical protein L484_019238 [Morus notabilis]
MGSKPRKKQVWCPQPLTPLMEGPDPEMQEEGSKKESSWEVIREWFRAQKGFQGSSNINSVSSSSSSTSSSTSSSYGCNIPAKRQDLRLLLGVLGCPLAPIPQVNHPIDHHHLLHLKDIPFETSIAHYIIQQYLAATGCLKQQKCNKNMYASGIVKMICCETEVSTGRNVKSLGTRSGESGCFVLWQMTPGMWSLELVVGGNKVVAGSDGKTVWRHTPWLGTHPAKGPQRPLRRLIQGLDPKSTASLFAKAQCLGEKRIGDDNCFVLKVSADRAAVMERSEGHTEVIRHALYGYFCQKSGLLIYLEDSHLTRVESPDNDTTADTVYWETTIGSSIGDYRDVDGVLIAHQGRSIATIFRCSELSMQYTRTRMEELWSIDDVVFNVPGLSVDSFLPPADILDGVH